MADDKPKGSGPSLVMLLVVVLLLTLVGAGTGFAVGALLSNSGTPSALPVAAPADAKATAEEKPAAGHAAEKPAHGAGAEAEAPAVVIFPPPVEADVPVVIVPLQPIITNLAAPEGAWVRVESSLLARKESAQSAELLAEKTSGHILAYLRTLRLSQIEGASGFLAFRDDLDDLVRTTSNGDVRKLLIKSLVVE